MKKVLAVALASVIHWILTLVCGLGELHSSRFFFKPEPSHPVWSMFLRIFEAPFLSIYRTMDPQRLKHYLPVMILNSLFWGLVLYSAILLIKKHRRGRRVKPAV